MENISRLTGGSFTKIEGVIIIEKVSSKVGNKLRRLRIQKNMTQQELAVLFGVTPASISYYETGTRIPSDKVKKQYSLFFDKPVDDIFF